MTAEEFAALIETVLLEADKSGLSTEAQIVVLQRIAGCSLSTERMFSGRCG